MLGNNPEVTMLKEPMHSFGHCDVTEEINKTEYVYPQKPKKS
jgi:hypothetical protein